MKYINLPVILKRNSVQNISYKIRIKNPNHTTRQSQHLKTHPTISHCSERYAGAELAYAGRPNNIRLSLTNQTFTRRIRKWQECIQETKVKVAVPAL